MTKRKLICALALSAIAISAVAPNVARAQSSGVELVVTSATLNVRSAPSTGDGVIGQLTCGQKVIANAKTNDGAWYRIDYNGQAGFVFAQFAIAGGACSDASVASAPAAPAQAPATQPQAAAAAPAAAAATGGSNVSVTSETLNVRSAPSTGGATVGKLKRGDAMQATAKTSDGKWLEIVYNGGKGYVFAQYTTFGGGTAAPAQAQTLAAAAAAPAAPAPAAKSGKWAFELGGHIKETNYLGQMRDVGMNWVKYQVVMPGGAPDLSGIIGAVHGAGLKILIGAIGDRGRAADTNYHKEFASYAAAVAAQGADAIEVWNEPNLDREYGGSGNGQVSPENYANMLREAFGAIKSVNPNVLVVGGAAAPTGYFNGCSNAGCDDAPFVARLAATGAAAWMDCMGAHHNGTMVGPDQTSGAPVGSAHHHQWYFWGTLGVVYNPFGGRIPVCWTELGYVTGDGIGPLPGGFSWGSSITMDNQAQWLARAAQLSRDSGKVRLMIIWNIDFRQWDDDPQAGFSIFRPSGECRACNTLRSVMGR